MEWWEKLATIASIGFLIQIIKWLLDTLNITDNIGKSMALLISSIAAILIVITIILHQTQKELSKIKRHLKNRELKKRKDTMTNNKKGMIDARILLVVMALVFLYLIIQKIWFT